MALAIGVLSFFLFRERRKNKVTEINEGGFRPPPTMESRDGGNNSWSAWSETTKVNGPVPNFSGMPRRPMNQQQQQHIQDLDGGGGGGNSQDRKNGGWRSHDDNNDNMI